MHGLGMETEGGGHGMSGVHGKKEKADPTKVIATVNNEKFLAKIWIIFLDRFKNHVNPAALPAMEQQITEQLVAQCLLRQFVTENKLSFPSEKLNRKLPKCGEHQKESCNKGKNIRTISGTAG